MATYHGGEPKRHRPPLSKGPQWAIPQSASHYLVVCIGGLVVRGGFPIYPLQEPVTFPQEQPHLPTKKRRKSLKAAESDPFPQPEPGLHRTASGLHRFCEAVCALFMSAKMVSTCHTGHGLLLTCMKGSTPTTSSMTWRQTSKVSRPQI